jgi:succinyl-CoA synthetase beta subunit
VYLTVFCFTLCVCDQVNPISETHDGRILCVDAKLNFDDNALYRQPELVAFRDYTQVRFTDGTLISLFRVWRSGAHTVS